MDDGVLCFACAFVAVPGLAILAFLSSYLNQRKRLDRVVSELADAQAEIVRIRQALSGLDARVRKTTVLIAPPTEPTTRPFSQSAEPIAAPSPIANVATVDELAARSTFAPKPAAVQERPVVEPDADAFAPGEPSQALDAAHLDASQDAPPPVAFESAEAPSSSTFARQPAPADATDLPEPATESAPPEPSFGEPLPPQPPIAPPIQPAQPQRPPADPPSESTLEQWLGVRGAAAAGSIVLAIAAVYFFRYSMEHQLISPAARVVIGLLTGLGCVAVSDLRLRHTNRVLSQFLAGAGFAILYLAVWASVAKYELISNTMAGVAMVAITSASCALAYVRDAAPTAALGLLGGFATPILLSTGKDRPIALFAYLFLLDAGLLLLARKRAWGWLGATSLVLTFGYQAVWIATKLDASRTWLGIGIVVVFAALFAVATPRGPGVGPIDRLTRVLAVVMSGVFAFVFGAMARLGDNLVPTTMMLLLLSASGAFLGRSEGMTWARSATALAAIGSFAALVARSGETPAFALKAAIAQALLVAVQFGANEFDRLRPVATTPEATSDPLTVWVASAGFDIVLGGALLIEFSRTAMGASYALVVHLVSLVVLIGIASLESIRGVVSARMLPVLVVLGLTLLSILTEHGLDPGVPSTTSFLAIVSLFGAAGLVTPLGVRRRLGPGAARFAEHGAGAFLAIAFVLLLTLPRAVPVPSLPFFAATIGLVLLTSLVSTLRGHGAWSLVAVLLVGVVLVDHGSRFPDPAVQSSLLVGYLVVAIAAAALPLYVGDRARQDPTTYRAASLAGPSVAFASVNAFRLRFGDDFDGFVPLAYSLFGLATLLHARARVTEPRARDVATVWGAIAALSLISVAIPMQLRDEWVTVSWALQGAIVVAIWSRFDHPGLKYYATMLFSFTFVRLVFNPYVLDYHPPSGFPILNWLAYSYLVPAAALVHAARTLAALEAQRLRKIERSITGDHPVLAAVFGVMALVVVFAWVNLTVFDAFAEGRQLTIPSSRMASRDLAISLAWAVYAASLLAIGVWKTLRPLRYASLLLVIVTCLKVFLYDLGALEDLYRVASLVGLAFTLIGVSLAYKRFVFRDPEIRS